MAGTGGRERRAGRGGACWSWQVDSICIWHTDCTKYANRQTMTFAVLFLLVIFQSPYKVNKKGSMHAAAHAFVVRALGAYTCQVCPSF